LILFTCHDGRTGCSPVAPLLSFLYGRRLYLFDPAEAHRPIHMLGALSSALVFAAALVLPRWLSPEQYDVALGIGTAAIFAHGMFAWSVPKTQHIVERASCRPVGIVGGFALLDWSITFAALAALLMRGSLDLERAGSFAVVTAAVLLVIGSVPLLNVGCFLVMGDRHGRRGA
jgi:hypothetical protein